jgi:hypothetical protein
MIQTPSAQTDPCDASAQVAVNPNRFAIVSSDHNSTALLRYKFEVRLDAENATLIQAYTFDKSQMQAFPNNCYVSPQYAVGPAIPRDGTTKYFSRWMAESSDPAISSDWSVKSPPFVLASKLRVGAIFNRFF